MLPSFVHLLFYDFFQVSIDIIYDFLFLSPTVGSIKHQYRLFCFDYNQLVLGKVSLALTGEGSFRHFLSNMNNSFSFLIYSKSRFTYLCQQVMDGWMDLPVAKM